MADDSSTIPSNADLAAMMAARQLAAIQPLQAAWQALLAAAQTAQAAMSGFTTGDAVNLVNNTLANGQAYVQQADHIIGQLSPPAAAAAPPAS